MEHHQWVTSTRLRDLQRWFTFELDPTGAHLKLRLVQYSCCTPRTSARSVTLGYGLWLSTDTERSRLAEELVDGLGVVGEAPPVGDLPVTKVEDLHRLVVERLVSPFCSSVD